MPSSLRNLRRALRVVALASALVSPAILRAFERLLFLDPATLSEANGASLSVNSPLRSEMVIRGDKPWEARMISFYTTVIEEDGKLRMWYICRDADNHP